MSDLGLITPVRPALTPSAELLRLHLPSPVEDPWELLRSPLARGRAAVAWYDPVDGRSFAAVGVALRRPARGPRRFALADAAWSELARNTRELGAAPDPSLPLAVSAFSFSHGMPPETWAGFDEGLWVPELILHSRGGRVSAAVASGLTLGEDAAMARLEALRQTLPLAAEALPDPSGASPVEIVDEEAGWPAWQARVLAAREALDAGRLRKVVLARSQALRAPQGAVFDAVATAFALRERQRGCTTYLLKRSDGSGFVGATPEELIRVSAGRLRTVALAGTRRRGAGDDDAALAQDLLRSPKDNEEHVLVAEAIVSSLDGLARDVTLPESPEVAGFVDVQHLRTPVEARLNDGVTPLQLLDRLHPTPAVGGLPRAEALAWLDDHEGLDRGWYAGPIGWVDSRGEGVFVVALRSALVRGAEATAFVGCGLVRGSEPRAEWDETRAKLGTILGGLRAAPVAKT